MIEEDVLEIVEEEHFVKKTISMEDLRILDICRDIELMNEQLYRYFAGLFAEEREISALWRKTANEEANHAKQFDLAIRLKNEMLESVSIDAGTAVSAFKFVRTVLESAKNSPPNAADAFQIAIKLEERLVSLHLECIAGFSEESHKELFRAMMACDNHHLESLLEAQKAYSKGTH
jgi:rubrerythrin